MRKDFFDFSENFLGKTISASLFIYLFLLIFHHTNTIREITFWTAVICWIGLRFKRPEPFITLNPVIASISVFMVIAFISSISGMEPVENLKRFKGELLAPYALFLIAATEFKNVDKIKHLLFAPVIAFAIYNLLAIYESTGYGLQYFWDKANREHYVWLTSYSQISAVIFPLTLGLILFVTNRGLKYFLIIFVAVEFAILTAYRGFAVFLGAMSVLLWWVLFAQPKKYKLWMAAFIFLFLFMSGLLLHMQKGNQAIEEYRSKIDVIMNITTEIKSEAGFSSRMPAWSAAVDIIKDKPLLGYGWGMKKFTKLVQQDKFLENWRVNKPYVYDFFTVSYKNSFFPPHNMLLEIAVQSGLLGLAAFITFVGIYVFQIIRKAIHTKSDIDHNFAVILVCGILLSFMTANLMSNELGNAGGKILFVVLGAGSAWIKGKDLTHIIH